ncbi:MAG: tRNA glutamyl-Q(34) synthetase GluQRS [Pacificimonas sp.]
MIVSRFAPSPTGRLHLGHAASALATHDFARAAAGRFLLRIEDIDAGRSRPEYVDGILQDLGWLGVTWDEPPLRQSTRMTAYAKALQVLQATDVVYPCFCTRRDIEEALSAPQADTRIGPDGALYPGTCRALDTAAVRRRTQTEAHAWRLDSQKAADVTGALTFTDHDVTLDVQPYLLGDVVIARKDAGTSYHLACTVDDAYQGVTDIVRGVDLLPSTHVHRTLQALLGLPEPRYRHHKLILGKDGERLAKRNGAAALAEMRASGLTLADIRARLSS